MESEPRRIKVQVKDKRRVTPDEQKTTADGAAPPDAVEPVVEGELVEEIAPSTLGGAVGIAPSTLGGAEGAAEEQPQKADYLADLQRMSADYANYRKRAQRESKEAAARGAERIVAQLLPVLDNFERAIAHGEGGEGVELVFKELKSVLENAGLEEVPGEGMPFDPKVHEAVETREDESVTEEVVREVHRRGYEMNGKLLRAAMVGVARPPAPQTAEETSEE